MPVKFDKELSSRIVPGGKDEPMFVDLDTGHFLSPPFALEPVDRSRPLAISNLAFPEPLKDWVRRQGIDAVVQTDGRTITLLGLDMKDGQPVPNPNAWPRLTPADVLKLFKPLPGQPWTCPLPANGHGLSASSRRKTRRSSCRSSPAREVSAF